MATIYPREPYPHSPKSELKVRKALASLENLVILHSVAWQTRRGKQQGDGEADFIVVVPTLGILILEVKGGGIEVVNGSWFSTSGDGNRHSIKNPFDQAKDSKYALLAYFRAVDTGLCNIPIVHAVVFPDVVVNAPLGSNAPRELIIDRADLQEPWLAIERVFRHWERKSTISTNELERLIRHLAPTITVRRLLRDTIGDVESELIELTAEQTRAFQMLKRVRKAAVLGGAGTGKTILAVEKARQLASSGFRTLLLCFNAPLQQHLAKTLAGSGVDVETFHSLTAREAKLARIKIPLTPANDWFESEAPRVLGAAAQKNGPRYDAILVDEAQDFAEEWLASTGSLLAENHLLYLFADSHQNLYRRGWTLPEGLIEFELTVNCRNTRQIALKVAALFGDHVDGNQIEGPIPRFVEVERGQQIGTTIVRLVETLLIEEKISPSQLVVLSDMNSVLSQLRTTGVCEYLFTIPGGYGIPVDSIYRFKGLEREVVVLALSDNLSGEELMTFAYVGISRARIGLYVVGSRKVRDAILWDS
ncbi:nuclease-related domain-containing DEAD/DEAH box helicase [Burkholderia multivorans]|uniref:nuclease-related domain-containing DEAD/DEAH box helicase n=1 Tax=Burkholderia multivorans TaxID=87883 RepID=UPI0020A0F640|nr:NERD domain-containing protein [Burkholderia multivorans]MCO8624482.1 NERD domain-containing protein [Burkholderia multivorans]